MSKENENENGNGNANGARPEQDDPKAVQVMVRFTRAELDKIREETGANADATAIACFVRKNLHKRG